MVCREWFPFDSEREVLAEGRDVLLRYPRSVLAQPPQFTYMFDDCRVWGVPAASASVREPAVSDIPTLILSGSFDSVTPLAWAYAAAETLPNSRIASIPGVGHFVAPESPCAQSVIASFLLRPDAPDTNCVATLRAPRLRGTVERPASCHECRRSVHHPRGAGGPRAAAGARPRDVSDYRGVVRPGRHRARHELPRRRLRRRRRDARARAPGGARGAGHRNRQGRDEAGDRPRGGRRRRRRGGGVPEGDILATELTPEYDAVYVRFLLTHLADPGAATVRIAAGLRPGGVLIVEDIDVTGSFCHPANAAYDRYAELYTRAAWARGVDPNIGPRLPQLLVAAGCKQVSMNVVQPTGMTPEGHEGDVKLVSPLTLENIADTAIAEGLATREEIEAVLDELYRLASDPTTVLAIPRIVQAWGYRDAT